MNELSRRGISELRTHMIASVATIQIRIIEFEILRWCWFGLFIFMFCVFFFLDFWHFEMVGKLYSTLKRKFVNENPGKKMPKAWELLYSALPKSYKKNSTRTLCICLVIIYTSLALYWLWRSYEFFLFLSIFSIPWLIDESLALRYAGTFKKKYLHVKKKPKKRKSADHDK